MEQKKGYLEQLLELHQKPYQAIKKVKGGCYQVVERSPTLTTLYVKLTEFCYCLPKF